MPLGPFQFVSCSFIYDSVHLCGENTEDPSLSLRGNPNEQGTRAALFN